MRDSLCASPACLLALREKLELPRQDFLSRCGFSCVVDENVRLWPEVESILFRFSRRGDDGVERERETDFA